MIGGKVLDPSAVASYARGRLMAVSWLAVARRTGIVLLLPELALDEVRAVLPGAGESLAALLDHPSIVRVNLGAASSREVERILDDAGMFDAVAGHVVQLATTRGWPVLSADPGRLHRLAPDLEVDPL